MEAISVENKMHFNQVLDNLKIYEAGKPIELVVREYGIDAKSVIKLASNENPRGSSPKVIEAVRQEATKMHLYPDDSMYELKEALAKNLIFLKITSSLGQEVIKLSLLLFIQKPMQPIKF